jgi:ribosome-associated toxin RatA of RatAB toxin-antitoxin module
MPIVQSSILISKPQSELFRFAQDYDLRLEWDPFLKAMKFLNGATEADVNVLVWVKAKNGLEMTVRYITINHPNRVAMEMVKGPFFFSRFAGTWIFDHLESKTKVTFKYNYDIKPLFRWILNPFVSRIFQKDIEERLNGLKIAAEETGIIGKLNSQKN